ncbi:WXG100 family type VII secretion target [Microbacterium marinilacus]|uniref:ESAT-6-like protein n=1 Tax=Microbacterium marinilacus TaxID=415209 RepID=A0ABP7BHJ6_9MICO|nr:WXG100 family type VII secretion target [Microbacterium marinilacus]
MGFKVNFAGLAAAADDMKNGAVRIATRLDDMDQALAPLRSDWTGSASEAYDIAKKNWTEALTDMKLLLQDISDQVRRDGEDFQGTENRNKQRWE